MGERCQRLLNMTGYAPNKAHPDVIRPINLQCVLLTPHEGPHVWEEDTYDWTKPLPEEACDRRSDAVQR